MAEINARGKLNEWTNKRRTGTGRGGGPRVEDLHTEGESKSRESGRSMNGQSKDLWTPGKLEENPFRAEC